MEIPKLIVRLTELICDAYEEEQFGMLLFEEIDENEFDYTKDAQGGAYKQRVFYTVRWANRVGLLPKVLWLAQVVARRRPQRNDLQDLAQEIQAALGAAQPNPPAPPNGAPAAPQPLPPELSTPIELFEQQAVKPMGLARDLRVLLRKKSYRDWDLAGRFHLSESDGERLTAILALETDPTPGYLRWLSERVTVEPPFAAFMAAKALTAASLRLNGTDLGRVRSVALDAADRLDGLAELNDQPGVGFDVASRKGQLQSALALTDMRSRPGRALLPPPDLDGFLKAVIAAFDRDGFDLMCRNRLQTSLKFLANPEDPIELIVVHVVLTARDRSWEAELIRAVYEERKNDATLAAIHNKYAV